MQNLLHITCVQLDILWESVEANLSKIDVLLTGIKTDLIVLPEMFSTGFSMNPNKCAELMDGKSIAWMKSKSAEMDCAIMGTLAIQVADKFYNRLIFVYPSGEMNYYDKRHLFTLTDEDKIYTPGQSKLIVNYKGWRICPLICYDLRFPVWSRNIEEFDLLIYMANWPKPRVSAWDTLLKARSIENMCYTIGVNRVGFDGNDYEYIGHSQCIDMLGAFVSEPKQEGEQVLQFVLDKKKLIETKNKFQFLNDKDSFSIEK